MRASKYQSVTNRPSQEIGEEAAIGLESRSLSDIVSFPYPKRRRDEWAVGSIELPAHILRWEDDGGHV